MGGSKETSSEELGDTVVRSGSAGGHDGADPCSARVSGRSQNSAGTKGWGELEEEEGAGVLWHVAWRKRERGEGLEALASRRWPRGGCALSTQLRACWRRRQGRGWAGLAWASPGA